MTRLMRNIFVSSTLMLSDFIGFTLAIYAAMEILDFVQPYNVLSIPEQPIDNWIKLHYLLAICCISWFSIRLRHYIYRKTYWLELKEILRTLLIFSVFEISIIAFSKLYFSRVLWGLTWMLVIILVPLMRVCTKQLLSKLGLWKRDALIIGCGKNAIDAYKAITSEKNLGFNIVGFINVGSDNSECESIDGVNVLLKDTQWLKEKNVDKRLQFILAVENNQTAARNNWLRALMINGYRYVSVIPTLRGVPLDNTDVSFIFSHEVMIFRVQQNLEKISSRIIKRTFDIFLSTLLIIILSPLFAYIIYKVKKDNGPGIYGHERIGKNGKVFKCLKFRSMAINSKEILSELLENDSEARKEWDLTFKLKNDPRITKIGAVLRKTSLDELPQLFNVLKGDMSLVGPRPVIYQELERYHEQVDYYLMSKPGMTGLWQVSGRSDVDYETRVYFDAWYVKNWSMWNDITILFKTISVVTGKTGAY